MFGMALLQSSLSLGCPNPNRVISGEFSGTDDLQQKEKMAG
jgi:hypothetical protein